VQPQTEYARSGDLNIAYQVVGDGPLDLVWVPPWVSHVEEAWEEPACAGFLKRLASFSRLIVFDKRGTGMSDRVPADRLPTLEERMDDMRAVMDAAGVERAAVFGSSEGGNMAVLFAATYPERTIALVTFGIFAKRVWSEDYPWAPTPEERERFFEVIEREWGRQMDIADLAPSAIRDPEFGARLTRWFRRAASPGAALALARMNTEIDVRAVLPTIQAPTLVLHRTGDRDSNVEGGRWIAAQIPNAKFIELDGDDHIPWVGDGESVLAAIEEFLTGQRPLPEPDRVLATLLFTDIVDSTVRAVALGDRAWRELLEQHHQIVRSELDRWRGRELDTAGDGFFASFDGPARAVRCAAGVVARVRELGLALRAGVHTGECERVEGSLRGVAVHIAARVAAQAAAGEVLVSSTVKDLVAGSGLEFDDRGTTVLKGIPGEWRIFAVRGTAT
jgi:pimeloyl-ACP methyl ester carboxylesterase